MVINGDPNDRTNYPGYAPAGVRVQVLPPFALQQTVIASLSLDEGYDRATVATAVSAALNRYINSLGVSKDVIFTELVHAAQSVPGVRDIVFNQPTGNVAIGSDELARVVSSNISVT